MVCTLSYNISRHQIRHLTPDEHKMELDRQLKANEVAEANFYGKGRWSITKDKWGEWSLRTQRSFRVSPFFASQPEFAIH